LVKKTAVKKAAAKKTSATKPTASLREIRRIHAHVQSLELDLRKLREKMTILFHDTFLVGPKPPTHRKPPTRKVPPTRKSE
jgi:hypothetical protein